MGGLLEIKRFNGGMDTDSPNESIGANYIKRGRNVRTRGVKGNYRYENIPGSTPIANALPSGVNECAGAFYDNLKSRIFYVNHNSNLNHGIYILDIGTLVVTPLIVNGTNTNGNILDVNLDEPIYNMKMLYGDAVQGDTLYFNNSLKEPLQINVERTIAGTYGVMTKDFLQVIKYPATRPPYVVYGDDSSITVNTLRKKLFKFKTRAVYFSKEKSICSQISELPLPINAQDTDIDKDPTKNCKVSLVYETLGADVEKIEILGAVTGKSDANSIIDPNQFGDYFLIDTIVKADLGLANNDIAIYEFYNDKAYIEIDPEESIQLQDLVPLQANALEMLNGNVPIYGGLTYGFDRVVVSGSAVASTIPAIDTQLPYTFTGSQSGDSAFGTGNIHIVLVGKIAIGYDFEFKTTNETISYTATVATTTNVINGLATAATTAGFTVVSSNANNLVISKAGESLQMVVREPPILAVTNQMVHNWNDKEAYGIVYYDKALRTNGVITTDGFTFETANYTETTGTPNIPRIVLTITHRPPDWAYSFNIVRTKSLAKSKFLYWVSDSTYKDDKFAYIGIESLNTFISNNKNANHLAYDFASGDRIRFVKVISGAVNTIYTNSDFEIIGQELAPVINGVQRSGQFIKITLPTTSGTFDFGTNDFANYQIEIYTPSQPIGEDLNKYYEIGERFKVGNPTLATRFHQGMTQNQTSNLVTPATFTFNKGDYYYRIREINVGAEYKFQIPQYDQNLGRTTMGCNFISESYTDPNITPGSSINRGLAGFNIATNTDRAILNNTSGIYKFRIKGAIVVDFQNFGENFSFYLQDSSSNITYLVPTGSIQQGPHSFSFDTTFQMSGASRLFIFAYSQVDYGNWKIYSQTDITITRELIYTIPVMDMNYSDYFPSAVNSNGRSLVEQPEASRVYDPVLYRWGLPNILNTNINQVSRFTPLNFDSVDAGKGDIELFWVNGRQLEVLQRRGCGWTGIYSKIIQDNTGATVLATTNDIITKNNIQYLAGGYGIGDQKGSFSSSKTGYYFTDSIMGYQVRRAGNGLTPLNELYKGQFEIRDIITPYSKSYTRTNGAKSKIISWYDYFEEEYVSIFQQGEFNSNAIPNNCLGFWEGENMYSSFYDHIPEWAISAEDKTFMWKNGAIYIMNNETDYCKFFGTQFYPSITLVFNDKVAIKKTFDTLAYQANKFWVADTIGDITTSQTNPQTGFSQVSQLIEQDFDIEENLFYAAFLKDGNSMSDAQQALVIGDDLKGVWIQVKLTYKGSNFAYIFAPYLKASSSPRNL